MSRKDRIVAGATVQQIYDKLLEVEAHIVKTNGRVKLSFWVATTAMTLITLLIVAHIPR